MLDNVIWSALATRHAHLARGDDRARRYPADMAPFLAVADEGPEAAAALRTLAEPAETLTLVGVIPPALPGWIVERRALVSQMVFDGPAVATEVDGRVAILGPADVPAMLDLMAEIYPGYFRPRTIAMGLYLGVCEGGRLIAMAGQRMALDGHREISGVATRPEHRGRGHAGRLVSRLVAAILGEDLTPFLHVDAENHAARSAYEKAGFVHRKDLPLARVRRDGDGHW
ncbi:GNAT family N-acetyltransferase [Paludisphaera soli]|uniref:GNAT family N-acetyltransferase n=1 Tax=Paludisphaera soli TaxID=2712865 RepID=UPI0013EB49B2|nr:GNAT family N-acetyltransferase [Paludisphaera soli]